MFHYRIWMPLALCTVMAGFAAGCGEEAPVDDSIAEERQMLGDGIPSWLAEIPSNWGCDQTLQGRFKGWDSAHMYRFPGKLDYRYDFVFEGKYPAHKGIVMAVYDTETGDLVAADWAWSNKIKLQYEAEKSIDYLVAVYSIAWQATGNYTLSASCEIVRYCVEYETLAEDGTPYRNFYAQNVKTYEEGKKLLTEVGPFVNENIQQGSCVAQSTYCEQVYAPVCGDSPEAQTEYGNVCEFKSHVRSMASRDDQWKGHWDVGPCDATGKFCGGIGGLPCPDGFVCVLDGSYPDAGGSCQPAACTYEGQDYLPGDSFPALDGCNTCSCTDSGMVACTKMACVCNPAAEWWRHYVATDVNTCAVMKYSCQPKTQHFSNECGCGCEQDAACPEWINCMPPTDCSQLRSDCPYSPVAW